MPTTITSIGASSFNECTSLTSIDIPNSVTTIAAGAFRYCEGLTNVTIGSGITYVGQLAFANCYNLTGIIINATVPPTLELGGYANAFDNTNNCPIYVPASAVNTYKAATGWSNYVNRITAIP